MAKRTRQPTRADNLPPIPTDTPEGIRVHAIADTLRALDEPLPESMSTGLELQNADVRALAKRLEVPRMFIETVMAERIERNTDVESIEEYIAWRQQLAGKAVV